ncbi:Smr/MutS family protein [Frigoriflavimonas asaccharolytica]|uniref:DNA-nicking Smr family endonuclease n=1 Tax=Frigoriflavimonas asaccharolytica TaxID=2735899 RepID=A0A8J8G9B9_9FLAO|nr:Smr/MutS family protein [Frigoriflavimonas asaccharolytica]NRS91357.1 DNA-nicking Smr family endonuclease [Frigoriflavimonas asaccharolytica]
MKIGDSISYLNENKTGKIIGLAINSVDVLDEFGFKETLSLNEIVLRDQDFYSKIHIEKKPETSKIKSKKNNSIIKILDLHFHLLVKNPTAYSPQARLQIQKEALLEMLDYCKKNPIKKLNIIHGIGDGTLQAMVFDLLKGYTNLEYEDENIFHQSSGSVMVTFR